MRIIQHCGFSAKHERRVLYLVFAAFALSLFPRPFLLSRYAARAPEMRPVMGVITSLGAPVRWSNHPVATATAIAIEMVIARALFFISLLVSLLLLYLLPTP
ncbi:hypothetical protein CXB45_05260 [Corynebacterium mastitidis]|uniref:Uncharacterized protein n=1 Tax=Corynebacterium mastitidis TaxID=161890 RepID=A0A2N0X7S6_9CORY|nr:hypothetical protein CXB45_05260 [Corynebacterium mastitidis]